VTTETTIFRSFRLELIFKTLTIEINGQKKDLPIMSAGLLSS